MNKHRVVFDKSVKKVILEMLNKEVNEDGLIVEKDNPDQKVLTFEGNELSFEDFGGVKKGSEVFIENNLISLLKLSKESK